jgi:hypothetical protein
MTAAKVEAADKDSTGFHRWPLLAKEQSLDVACYAHYQPSRVVDAVPLFEAIANRNLANAHSVIDLTIPRAWYTICRACIRDAIVHYGVDCLAPRLTSSSLKSLLKHSTTKFSIEHSFLTRVTTRLVFNDDVSLFEGYLLEKPESNNISFDSLIGRSQHKKIYKDTT